MEKVQMTEEQAIKVIQCIFDTESREFNYAIENLKRAGYIIRPIWEEAEEMYNEYHGHCSKFSVSELIDKQHEAIQELLKELDKFKKE